MVLFFNTFLSILCNNGFNLIHNGSNPYHNHLLNKYDGPFCFYYSFLVTALPMVESFDSFNSNLLIVIVLLLVLLPSVRFGAVKLMTNERKIKMLPVYCFSTALVFACGYDHIQMSIMKCLYTILKQLIHWVILAAITASLFITNNILCVHLLICTMFIIRPYQRRV